MEGKNHEQTEVGVRLGRIALGSRPNRLAWVVVGAVVVLAGCTAAAPPPASIVDVVGDARPLEDPPSRIEVVDGPDIREVTVAAAGGGIRAEIASSMEIDDILSADALDNGPHWYVRMWPPGDDVTYMVAASPDRKVGVPVRAVGFHAVLCEDPVPSLHRWVPDLYSCPNFVDLPQGAVTVEGDTVTIEVPGTFAPELGGGFTWIASTYWNTSPVFTFGFRDDAPDVPRLAVTHSSDTTAVGTASGSGSEFEVDGVSHPPLEFRATFPG